MPAVTVEEARPTLQTKKIRVPVNTNSQDFETVFSQVESAAKVLDNKIILWKDKVQEFMQQSLMASIEMTENSEVLIESTKKDKLELLRKYYKNCEHLVAKIDEIAKSRKEIRSKLDSHKSGDAEKQLVIENLHALDKEIKQIGEQLKDVEREFKDDYVLYMTFKDSADLIDNYENMLQELTDEIPLIQKSVQKLKTGIDEFHKMNEQGIKGNVNYEKKFYQQEVQNIVAIEDEYNTLVPKVHQFEQWIKDIASRRNDVNEKKFTDTHFVTLEYQKLLDTGKLRDHCKKLHDQIKKLIKEQRGKFQESHLETLSQRLEARLNQLQRELEDYNQTLQKKKKDMTQVKQLLKEATALEQLQDKLGADIQQMLKMKNPLMTDLIPLVLRIKQLTLDVMDIESKVGAVLIYYFKMKIENLFGRIDEKFILLNETKYKLSVEDEQSFEEMSLVYLKIKSKFQDIFSKDYFYNENAVNDPYQLKETSAVIIQTAREILHMYLETKMATKKIVDIPVPQIQRFTCIVDEMMFRFKDMKRTNLIIQKLAPQTYRFGTRKIQAKVTCGVLLIRVGGGYMDVENFFNLYAEQEIVKQIRELEQIAQGKVPTNPLGKKAELPKFTNLKKKNPNNRYGIQSQQTPKEDRGSQKINSEENENGGSQENGDEDDVGEYEIDLGLDDDGNNEGNIEGEDSNVDDSQNNLPHNRSLEDDVLRNSSTSVEIKAGQFTPNQTMSSHSEVDPKRLSNPPNAQKNNFVSPAGSQKSSQSAAQKVNSTGRVSVKKGKK